MNPTLRADLHSGLAQVVACLNMAESFERSLHWRDGLSDHEQALADLSDALRARACGPPGPGTQPRPAGRPLTAQ